MNILQTYGIKELYDAQLRAVDPIEIGDRIIQAKEPIATFNNIQVGDFKELTKKTEARGGVDNRAHISWNDTRGVTVRFTQGVFSQAHIAISSNAKIEEIQDTEVMKKEDFEVMEDMMVELKYAPIEDSLFVYDSEMNKITTYTIEDKKLIFTDIKPYSDIIVYYDFLYSEKVSKLIVGSELINGYVEFRAKTRLRDDNGNVKTGLLIMKRVKLMSDLSIRLGKDTPPTSVSFEIFSYPTGARGQETSMDLIFLNDDIDSDL